MNKRELQKEMNKQTVKAFQMLDKEWKIGQEIDAKTMSIMMNGFISPENLERRFNPTGFYENSYHPKEAIEESLFGLSFKYSVRRTSVKRTYVNADNPLDTIKISKRTLFFKRK